MTDYSPQTLKELAEAIENYERAKKYFEEVTTFAKPDNGKYGVTIGWTWTAGSLDFNLQRIVSNLVNEDFPRYLQSAVNIMEGKVEELKKKVFGGP